MDQHEQQQIDQLILENGEYSPLDYLLQQGRLNYSDYEAWRNGNIELLSDVLFGNLEQIVEQWINAEEYLQQLGWQSETLTYHPIQNDNHERLVFSLDSKLEFYFHKRFSKSADQPQADLFMDSQATTVFNTDTQAILDQNTKEARKNLERLFDIAPGHNHLGELECLVEALESLNANVDEARQEIQSLKTNITPAAKMLLRKNSRQLLIPLWRRLSQALAQQHFLTNEPELHRSYTAMFAQDWDQVRSCIETETNWQQSPTLLTRHAQACDRLRLPGEALLSWFELCWRFPQESDVIEDKASDEVKKQWIRFQELEPELPAYEFPAWSIITKPGWLKIIPTPPQEKPNNAKSYNVVQRLLVEKTEATSSKDNINLRAQLKQESPGLFQFYIVAIG